MYIWLYYSFLMLILCYVILHLTAPLSLKTKNEGSIFGNHIILILLLAKSNWWSRSSKCWPILSINHQLPRHTTARLTMSPRRFTSLHSIPKAVHEMPNEFFRARVLVWKWGLKKKIFCHPPAFKFETFGLASFYRRVEPWRRKGYSSQRWSRRNSSVWVSTQ